MPTNVGASEQRYQMFLSLRGSGDGRIKPTCARR